MPDNKHKERLDYKAAGVDIEAGDSLADRIRSISKTTLRPGVIAAPGGFAGLFRLSDAKYRKPVLVSSSDGVGTKLKLAQLLKRHDTVGIDLVAMCVNDILTHGGEPIFFLDYFACGKLAATQADAIIKGIVAGCKLAGCTLIGGETAEMPSMYPDGDYDLAGFAVGLAEEDALCGKHRVQNDDVIIGLASSGVHANGYSLVRKILAQSGADLEQDFDGRTLGEVLLAPTHIYVETLLPLIKQHKIHALAHITGGGISNNLPRILCDGLAAKLQKDSWVRPPIFNWLRQNGKVAEMEMLRVFNCGIGMMLVVGRNDCDAVLSHLEAESCTAWLVGEVCNDTEQTRVAYC